MTCAVYWIHHPSHTDIFSQGYVGVSVNTDVRFRKHKRAKQNAHLRNAINKYGWDNLVKKTVLIADTDYCLEVETKLRSKDDIGWNIVKGGGMPPKSKKGQGKGRIGWGRGRKLSAETCKKISDSVKEQMKDPARLEFNRQINLGNTYRRGKKHTAEALAKISNSKKGSVSRLGVKNSPETIEKMKQLAVGQRWTCVHCSKTGLAKGAGIRWHFDNCKFKEQTPCL
jgi:group I intron endonuclease